MSKWAKLGFATLVAAVMSSAGGMGCVAERDPINRVQANAMPKSFFVGAKLNDSSDDPEFYARTMVIDVPYGESGAQWGLFTNSINSVARIKWEVEEKNLVGRVSYERIIGTDGKGPTPQKDPQRDPSKPLAQNDGIVVYNFKIDKQFDVRRQYNPQTGEETNIVEENDSDRPWYEREYVRVDFSKNLVTTAYDFDTMSLLGFFGQVKYTPMEFAVQNPLDENAPAVDVKSGYFDVTNKVFTEPQELDFGWIKFPACFFSNLVIGGTEPAGNCNPNEITLRHSFRRVEKNDYEPVDWDGQRFETYGAFTTERNGYARDYGLADQMRRRFISRYDIWERNHVYKDPATMTGESSCKADSQCIGLGKVEGISRCDIHTEKCTLPYQERKAKPIVWHYADTSAPEFFEATRDATEEWDTAMRVAVQAAKYAECARFGNANPDPALEQMPCDQAYPGAIDGNFADEEDAVFLVKEVNACRRTAVADHKADPIAECSPLADDLGAKRKYPPSVVAIAKMKPMVMLCHSPVAELDPQECGARGSVARKGDLRYHLVTSIATPETGSPWGIMSDSNDPLTGEHIAASINVWTHVDDLFARGLVDTFRYIGGELKTADITNGTYVNKWVEAARLSSGSAATHTMDADEVDKRIAAIAGTTVEKLREVDAKRRASVPMKGPIDAATRTPLENALFANLQKVAQTRASLDAPTTNAPMNEARMNLLRGTPVEAEVVTPAMQQLGQSALGDVGRTTGSSNGTATSFGAASILQGLNPKLRSDLYNKFENALAARGACISRYEALAPLGYAALADELQAKFGKFNPAEDYVAQSDRAEKMKDYLRRRAHFSVVAHEMGHSFGLRHNFVSSSDAWNYRPQYWALRTSGKTVTTVCSSEADGASGAKNGASCVGPRWLDKVTANEQKNMIEQWAQSSTMEYPGEPSQDLLGIGVYDFGAARMFYGDAVTVYKDQRFNVARAGGKAAQDHQNDFGGLLGQRYGSFSSPIHYSLLDKNFDLIEKCGNVDPKAFKPTNWNDAVDGAWSPLLDGHIVTNEQGAPIKCTQPKVDFVQWDAMRSSSDKTHTTDKGGRARVPHGFASDNWADLGNVAVFRHDNGADLYEQMHFWQAQQEMTHIFTNYRRGRRDFSVWGAFERTLGRYHEKMRDSAKAIGLYATIARETVVTYNSNDSNSRDNPEAYSASILKTYATEGAIASSIAFDQFAHVFARPQPGDHNVLGDEKPVNGVTIARSLDSTGFASGAGGVQALLKVPNGVSGGYGTISLGGRPIENALDRTQGRDYYADYTLNVGSYYEKAFTAYLMTESADNFISASRDDFVDPRYRAVSIADVFPDGFRRWLANNLTNDEVIKGVYPRGKDGGAKGAPQLDQDGFAVLGTTSWWPTTGIETCFPTDDRLFCHDPYKTGTPSPAGSTVIDPQVGFEQQKFAILFSLIFLPSNARTNWLDMMRIYDVAKDSDPGFDNRIEFHNPDGKIYVAQTFGTEVLFGKTVQKGIAARVLEWANELLKKSVVTEPVLRDGRTVGFAPKLDDKGNVQYLRGTDSVSTCSASADCQRMQDYTAIPKFLHEAESILGFARIGGGLRGVY